MSSTQFDASRRQLEKVLEALSTLAFRNLLFTLTKFFLSRESVDSRLRPGIVPGSNRPCGFSGIGISISIGVCKSIGTSFSIGVFNSIGTSLYIDRSFGICTRISLFKTQSRFEYLFM